MEYTYYSAFGGVDAWGKALQRVVERHNDQCKMLGYWEQDKYASNALAAIHDVSEDINHWDIMDEEYDLPYADIFFYSPPCQTYSIAGKQEGSTVDKGNLFWNALQKIKVIKPKYCIMENVANLANQFRADLDNMLIDLEKSGYENYAKVMNTKDYGIPQNRARIFIVSIRKDLYEEGQRWELPTPIPLKLKLRDLLEDEVDEKYYLSDEVVSRFISKPIGADIIGTTAPESRTIGQRDLVYGPDGCIGALTATDYKQPKQVAVQQVGNLNPSGSFNGNPQVGRVYSGEGLSPTLSTMQGGGQEPKILVKSATVGGARSSKPRRFNKPRTPKQQDEKGKSG